MRPTDKAWQRLVKVARQAPDDRGWTAPYGFATQVAARAFEKKRPAMSLIERFSLRALGVSCSLAVLGATIRSLPRPPHPKRPKAFSRLMILPPLFWG